MEMVREQDSEDDVVHRRSTEGDDSILGIFFCKPLQKKLQDEQRVSWIADQTSHMICLDMHEIESRPCR